MVEKSKRNLAFAFTLLLLAIWLILSRGTWDFLARLLLVGAIAPVMWALLRKKNNKLGLAITLFGLLVIASLIWLESVNIAYALPLLLFAIVAVKWSVRDKTKPARLLGFFVKTFTMFLIGTAAAYFIVWLGITAPHTYGVYPIHAIVETGMVFIFPISLLLEAISIMIYGILRIELKPWEIFLSSWYASIFVSILVVFTLWMPRTPASPYSSIAGAIGVALGLVFLSLLIASIIAGILTIVYLSLKDTEN